MKIIVAFSGGKDSHASLIWAVKKYGKDRVEAVFCDTEWESVVTYGHLRKIIKDLGVKSVDLRSEKYNGMIELAKKKKRFPSTKARFCTSELKTIPMINYVLSHQENLLIIQGIRKDESEARSLMDKQCTYFKYYFEPYKKTLKVKIIKPGLFKQPLITRKPIVGKLNLKVKSHYHTYRKKDVLEWRKKYCDDILRPVFNWTGKQVVDYILEAKQKPNPLYYKGFSRVGCFPCVMCSLSELTQMLIYYPERLDELEQIEKELGTTFFPPDKIPKRYRNKQGYADIPSIRKYLEDQRATGNLFEQQTEAPKCMSLYGICE